MGEIQLEEDIKFERKEWRVERITYAVWAVVLLLAFLGLFGSGPLSQVETKSAGLTVNYERFSRHRNRSELSVSTVATSDKLKVLIDKSFLENYQVETIVPEPDSSGFESGKYAYEFKSTAGDEVKVLFEINANRLGRTSGDIEVEGAGSAKIAQTIYP